MTVLEIAHLEIKDGAQPHFEEAMAAGIGLVQSAEGCNEARWLKSVDNSQNYALLVTWRAIEDHTEHFASTAEFSRFIGGIAEFLASEPRVEHFGFDQA